MARGRRMVTLRLATRSSPLALEQAARVAHRLEAVGVATETVTVESEGDVRRDLPISALGSYGAFTNAIEAAVVAGRADIAVHSAKDLPAATDEGALVLGAVPERVDPRDVLVGGRLDELAPGALVLSGSARRRAQLAHLRPDLCFDELRGNIATRLTKATATSAVVVALAALERLGLEPSDSEVLSLSVMLPMVGQGALALRCRADDEASRTALAAIDEARLHRALDAERAFLSTLGGGCRAPLGAYAVAEGETGTIELTGLLATPDGRIVIRRTAAGEDPQLLGSSLVKTMMHEDGAAEIAEAFG